MNKNNKADLMIGRDPETGNAVIGIETKNGVASVETSNEQLDKIIATLIQIRVMSGGKIKTVEGFLQ